MIVFQNYQELLLPIIKCIKHKTTVDGMVIIQKLTIIFELKITMYQMRPILHV